MSSFKYSIENPERELLFTPCLVTRFAMHRIYADRINPRGMSRPPTVRQPKTQPFLTAIQCSADASSISRQTTRKLSLSSKLSSAALIAHPSPGRSHSTQHLHPNSRAAIFPGRLEKAAHASRASVFQQKKNSNEPQIHHCSSLIS